MQISFEEKDINMAIMMLNQIKVEGIQQASLLVAVNNILIKGERIERAKNGTGTERPKKTAKEEPYWQLEASLII